MFRDVNGDVFLNITAYLCGSFFGDKAPKSPNINMFSLTQVVFYFFKKGLQGDQNVYFRNAGTFRNTVY